MRKAVTALALLVFLAGVATAGVGASEHIRSPNPRVQEVKEKIQERRATQAARLAEHRKELIRKFWRKMMQRMEAAIKRLERLVERIESRIGKLQAQGENVAGIQAQVDAAQTKLASASAELEATDNQLESILSSNDPRSAFAQVGQNVRSIKRQLVEVHRLLVHLIGDIKGLRVGQTKSPSPTPTPTP